MTSEPEEYYEETLRDFAAVLAMCGLLMSTKTTDLVDIPVGAYDLADKLMEERRSRSGVGIAAIKPKRRYERRTAE